ncbi:MAG TPA: chromate efflux transporter [Candidatus Binatia bacterium]|nr:chromate efflux transporter [Candidatus Binatia bacterium]
MMGPASGARERLVELALVFARLGATAFGGPAAHVALMEHELVERRGWLARGEFLDLIGAANLIPGPNSTEVAMHAGRRRAGAAGLVVAGVCFIVPATLLVAGCAAAYVRFGRLPATASVLRGVRPVVIAVVVQALWRLGRTALATPALVLVALVVAALDVAGASPIVLLLTAGGAGALARIGRPGLAAGLAAAGSAPAAAAAPAVGLVPLFLVFAKIGSVLFGSGYVLLAFLRADLVERLHWLTETELLDAVAIGQATPGPVSTAATFVGYLLAGAPGAAVATAGIFLPAFVFVAASGPLLPRLRRAPASAGFLDGVNAAALALMAVVAWQLGRAAIVDLPTAALALASAVLLVATRVGSAWLVVSGALVGLAL